MLRPEADKSDRYLLFCGKLRALAIETGATTPFEESRMARRVVTLTNRGDVGAAIDYLSEKLRFQGKSPSEIARWICPLLPYLYKWIDQTPPAPEY